MQVWGLGFRVYMQVLRCRPLQLVQVQGLLEIRDRMPPRGWPFFFFFTLVTGPRRSLSLKLSDARVYEP